MSTYYVMSTSDAARLHAYFGSFLTHDLFAEPSKLNKQPENREGEPVLPPEKEVKWGASSPFGVLISRHPGTISNAEMPPGPAHSRYK